MNISETAEYYYAEILDCAKDEKLSFAKKSLKIYAFFKGFCIKIAEHENAYFPSDFARIFYLFEKYGIIRSFRIEIFNLSNFARQLKKDKKAICEEPDFCRTLYSVCEFLSLVSDLSVPEEIVEIYSNKEMTLFPEFEITDNANIERALVLKTEKNLISSAGAKYSILECVSATGVEFKIFLLGFWSDFASLCVKRSVFNAFGLKKQDDESYVTTSESMLALEPDYLVDATDIADKFNSKGQSHYQYFISKFLAPSSSVNLLIGNIVNHLFDEIIVNPEVDFDSSMERALKNKPFQLFSIVENDRNAMKSIRFTLAESFQSLKMAAAKLNSASYSVEPSFISANYGLQGRLDLLLEYEDDYFRKDVVELKSGKAPNLESTYSENGKTIKSGIWRNHLAQTTCYNMLLDSAFPGRKGVSSILYSKAEIHPIRNAPNIQFLKSEVLMFRNWAIALEKAIMNGKFSIFDTLSADSFGDLPPYSKDDALVFLKTYQNMDSTEKAYFQNFVSFIFRESYHSKIGSREDGTSKGFSSLWLDSIAEKEQSGSIITGLTLLPEECDYETMKLVFSREPSAVAPVFREGDICILYPVSGVAANPLGNQIIKGSLRTLQQDKVIVSLRNKMIRNNFNESLTWALEADYIDSMNKALFVSLYDFMSAPKSFKKLIFGQRLPEFNEIEVEEYTDLNENQKIILKAALSAEDYFLIQGPPGTGKTSYMLRYLVKTIFETTNENILLLAYTNRAADEICSSLKRISSDFPFLRLGSKESSAHEDNLVSALADSIGLRDLFKRMEKTRVFVSTVSSALNTRELFEIKKFNTAIIDEASQILEPQIIGLLTKVKRFIMIGDEKQLPAVVTQPENYLATNSPELHEIGLDNLGHSLFERLLQKCVAAGETRAYGLLERQARMHEKIQVLSNEMFYSGALKIFDGIRQTENLFFKNETDDFLKKWNKSRCIFIDTATERTGKINMQEAKIVAQIINSVYESLGDEFCDSTIGAIGSFRAQCAQISSELPENLRSIVAVDTVERFQGSERECIVVSFAVNDSYRMNFLTASMKLIGGDLIDRKLNVALTRAKNCLALVGNSYLLSKSPVYSEMIETIKQSGGYIKAKDFYGLYY